MSNSPETIRNVKQFMRHNFRHFNAAVVIDAAEGWCQHISKGGKMLVTLGGAMSTAELGLSLAAMIRQGKVDAITCTGANLEEDVFNLVAHEHYRRIPEWRTLTVDEEMQLAAKGMNRVTDTCIPEDTAIRKIEHHILKLWKAQDSAGKSLFPHEYFYELLRSGDLKKDYQIDPQDSWLMAAAERNLPIFVPGWEDSTLGNIFVARHIEGQIERLETVRSGTHAMKALVHWYRQTAPQTPIGFFQIGGGIAGDFPICAVPLIRQDLEEDVPLWGYFCQIGDSTTSYGSYSGAVPNEKITWGKLSGETPRFMIESDATIVAPLIFAYVLAS